jgi:hypothetical protein
VSLRDVIARRSAAVVAASSPFDDAACIYRFDNEAEITSGFYLRDYSGNGNYLTNSQSNAGTWTNGWGGAWKGASSAQYFDSRSAFAGVSSSGTVLVAVFLPVQAANSFFYMLEASTNTTDEVFLRDRTSGGNKHEYDASSGWAMSAGVTPTNDVAVFAVTWGSGAAQSYYSQTPSSLVLAGTDSSFTAPNSGTNTWLRVGGYEGGSSASWISYFAKWGRALSSNELVTVTATVLQKAGK